MRLSVRPKVSVTISSRSSQAGTHTAPSSIAPTRSFGKLLEHLVEDERRQGDLHPVAHGHVDQPGEVFASAVEVRLGPPSRCS